MSTSGQDIYGGSDDRGHSFITLYLENERRIYGFIMALVPNWADADDILQETTKVMWSKYGEFTMGSNFLGWAFTIAKFQVLNHLSKKRGDKLRFHENLIETIAADASMNEKQSDLRDSLRDCIGRLGKTERQLLELRYENNASPKKVAEQIGKGVDTVYKALTRVHNQLFYCIKRKLSIGRKL
ncbi:MAG: sigma-70 family RNA polymerase sigma factor [Anaerohalosphaera sp.]|nr:sigma-70 family RNA polymerase sigma factor [Anaerohalosphaera sp.]